MKSLELHIIQSYPANRLNRGEDGGPKSITFGGVPRTRISSQAQKRAERTNPHHALTPAAHRTKNPDTLILAALRGGHPDLAEHPATPDLVREALSVPYGKWDDTGRLKTQVFLGAEEVQAITAAITRGLPDVLKLPEADQAAAAHTLLGDLTGSAQSPDIALYGRMLAESDGWNVEAATSYTHAISTHRAQVTSDFFSSVDDVTGNTVHIGATELTAPTLYRAAVLDLTQLARNTTAAPTATLARDWARRVVASTPSGGTHGTFAHTLPEYVLVIARDGGHPLTLAGAFEDPVRRDDHSLATESARRLEGHLQGLTALYGPQGMQGAWRVTLLTLPAATAVTAPESLEDALSQALSALNVE